MEMTDVITSVEGMPVTVADVCIRIKANGVFRKTIYELIGDAVVRQRLTQSGDEPTPDEIEHYLEQSRLQLGLTDELRLERYCRWLGVTPEQWRELAVTELRHRRLKQGLPLAGEEGEEGRTVSVSRIVVRERALIEELRLRLLEGEDFGAIAREHSVEEATRLCGGYFGWFPQALLPKALASRKRLRPGELIGPVYEAPFYQLYRIEGLREGNGEQAQRERAYSQWLNVAIQHARP